jgi:hypothetical protein
MPTDLYRIRQIASVEPLISPELRVQEPNAGHLRNERIETALANQPDVRSRLPACGQALARSSASQVSRAGPPKSVRGIPAAIYGEDGDHGHEAPTEADAPKGNGPGGLGLPRPSYSLSAKQ